VAQVGSTVKLRVDVLLGSLLAAWASLPRIVEQIDQLDLVDQLDFTEEWPLFEDQLRELRQRAAAGVRSPEQTA